MVPNGPKEPFCMYIVARIFRLLLLKQIYIPEWRGRDPPITEECSRKTPLKRSLFHIIENIFSVSKPKSTLQHKLKSLWRIVQWSCYGIIQYKRRRKENNLWKIIKWRIRAHTFLRYTSGLTLVPFLRARKAFQRALSHSERLSDMLQSLRSPCLWWLEQNVHPE